MRRSEIVVAGLLAVFSVYLMWKSAELNISYVAGEGPGGGFWSFWLAAGMLVSTCFIALRWRQRLSPPSRSIEPVLDFHGWRMLAQVGGGLAAFIGLVHIAGMYGAILCFLVYYLRFLGRHGWAMTAAISIATPVAFFFFFDVLMRVVLPKGYLEPLFIPLYAIFL